MKETELIKLLNQYEYVVDEYDNKIQVTIYKEIVKKDREDIQFGEMAMEIFNKITGRKLKLTQSRQKLLTKLYKEGYTLEQVEYVVTNRYDQWGRDRVMSQYVRPATLFAFANFEKYVDEAPAVDNSGQAYIKNSKEEDERLAKLFS